jgi:hypothetical protein
MCQLDHRELRHGNSPNEHSLVARSSGTGCRVYFRRRSSIFLSSSFLAGPRWNLLKAFPWPWSYQYPRQAHYRYGLGRQFQYRLDVINTLRVLYFQYRFFG